VSEGHRSQTHPCNGTDLLAFTDWRKVDQVTPPNAFLSAYEHVYFLTRRPPPSGMEVWDSHKLGLPVALADSMHIVTGTELDRRIKAGVYSTVESTLSEKQITGLGLAQLYSQKIATATSHRGLCGVLGPQVTTLATPYLLLPQRGHVMLHAAAKVHASERSELCRKGHLNLS
jgi:hypothetical protein